MPKFQVKETVSGTLRAKTVRLGAGTGVGNNLSSEKETGKAVKQVGESRFDLAAVGNPIEGFIVAIESATQDGYSIGSVQDEGYKNVTFDGLQAAPGTGTIAVGDYVVTGTPVAKGTAITGFVKVCKATDQPGAVAAALANVGPQIANSIFAWRVASLGSAGTGAVGTTGVIERVSK